MAKDFKVTKSVVLTMDNIEYIRRRQQNMYCFSEALSQIIHESKKLRQVMTQKHTDAHLEAMRREKREDEIKSNQRKEAVN